MNDEDKLIEERVDAAIEKLWAMSPEEFRAVFESEDEASVNIPLEVHHQTEVYRHLSARKADSFEAFKMGSLEVSFTVPATMPATSRKSTANSDSEQAGTVVEAEAA